MFRVHLGAVKTLQLGILLLAAAPAGAETRVLHDFDHARLEEQWRPQGPVSLDRKAGPEFADTVAGSDSPGDKAVHVRTKGQAMMVTLPVTAVTSWPAVRNVGVWIHREAGSGEAPTLELQLLEKDRKTRLWRKATIDHAGWKRYEFPLAWMRWSNGRVPRVEAVERLGFFFRDPADLWIDTISADVGTPTSGAARSLDELAAVAFPHLAPEQVVRFVTPEVHVLAEGSPQDVERIGQHLVTVAERMNADHARIHRRTAPGVLVILRDEAEYRQAVLRVAEKLASAVEEPTSDGFTMQGIAFGSWDAGHGVLRPSLTHEFAHSYSEARLELPNRREWLHEAIAAYYQQRFHPQENFGRIVEKGLASEDRRMTLERLTDGRPIPGKRYWQAATLFAMLRDSPRFAASFPALIDAFREKGSTELAPHLDLLGTDMVGLEADWRAWCAEDPLR